MRITSLQNETIKEAVRLRNRKERDETGLFIIEGYRELKRAVDAGVQLEALFYCPSMFLDSGARRLLEQVGDLCIECLELVFQKISYRDSPDGIIGVARQMNRSLSDLDTIFATKTNPFFVVAESIEKPGNLGTILRSCDAAGVDAVLVCDPTTDIYNPNVVRSSMGTLFTIPVIQATSAEVLELLKEKGISIAATTPRAKAVYTETDLTGPVAIVVGAEQNGLSDAWMKEADIQMLIPMHGVADSLNVASATTLVLYEVVRQRKA
jgi:TrmH family RNA methyltransferase